MNPLGKEQSTVFETLEKGNFIAPAGGDLKDEQDTPLLKRAFQLLLPGIALACLLPVLLDGMELAVFLGTLLMIVGAVKLTGEDRGFLVGVILTAVQILVLAFLLVAQTTVTAWMGSAAYTVAGYGVLALSAAIPAALAAAVWKSFPQYKAPMLLLFVFTLIGAVSAALIPGVFLMRLLPALLGAAMLAWLAILTWKES